MFLWLTINANKLDLLMWPFPSLKWTDVLYNINVWCEMNNFNIVMNVRTKIETFKINLASEEWRILLTIFSLPPKQYFIIEYQRSNEMRIVKLTIIVDVIDEIVTKRRDKIDEIDVNICTNVHRNIWMITLSFHKNQQRKERRHRFVRKINISFDINFYSLFIAFLFSDLFFV